MSIRVDSFPILLPQTGLEIVNDTTLHRSIQPVLGVHRCDNFIALAGVVDESFASYDNHNLLSSLMENGCVPRSRRGGLSSRLSWKDLGSLPICSGRGILAGQAPTA